MVEGLERESLTLNHDQREEESQEGLWTDELSELNSSLDVR